MATFNKFFQKVLEIKIWNHYLIKKPAVFCKLNFSQVHHIKIMIFWLFDKRGPKFCLERQSQQNVLKKKVSMVMYSIKYYFWCLKNPWIVINFFCLNLSILETFEYRSQKLECRVFHPSGFITEYKFTIRNEKSNQIRGFKICYYPSILTPR